MAGEGNPDDPAQARMQVSIHVQSGGATVGPAGARSSPNAFADTISSHNTLECGRNASVPDDLRAAETAFVHLCLSKMATVDTTSPDAELADNFLARTWHLLTSHGYTYSCVLTCLPL